MIRPGPLSPADANYINDQLRELDVLRRQVQGLLGQAPELIPAAITSQTTVSWTTYTTNSTGTTLTTYSVVQHGWYEQGHDVQGTRVTLIGGRTGTNLVDPARTPSGSTISPAPTPTSPVNVWLRKTGLAATHGMIHEVIQIAGGSGSGSGFARFSLSTALDTTVTSVTSCTVDGSWGSPDAGTRITVWNLPASSNFMFNGTSGAKGLATYDSVTGKWWIIQLQC